MRTNVISRAPLRLMTVFICMASSMQTLLNTAYAQAVQPGHTAHWYAPERSGEGWVLEILDAERALVYWFTYDETGGQRWLIDVGEIQDNRIIFPELTVTGGGRFGPDFEPDDVIREVAGEGIMIFDDCTTGTFEYNAFDQQGAIAFRRLSRTAGLPCDTFSGDVTDHGAGFTGSWYDRSHSGEGFTLQWMNSGEAVLIWFTYDIHGNQYWILGVGRRQAGDIVFSDLHATRGARFGHDFDATDVEKYAWGELRLTLNCASGTARYDSILPEFGSGELNIVPLTRPDGVACQIPTLAWSGNGPFGGTINFLEVSSNDPAWIYASGPNGLFRSANEGMDWQDISAGLPHRLIHGLAVDPHDAATAYVAVAGLLYRTRDAGDSWQYSDPDPGLELSGGWTIDVKPDDTREITIGAVDRGGIYRSSDGGEQWTRIDGARFDGVFSFIQPAEYPDVIVTVGIDSETGSGVVLRTGSAGLEWDGGFPQPSAFRSSYRFLNLGADRLLLYDQYHVFESLDGGLSWNRFSINCPSVDDYAFDVYAMALDPANPGTWYLGGLRGLARTSDEGASCAILDTGLTTISDSEQAAGILNLRFMPGKPDTMLAGTQNVGFFHSDDSGASWQPRNKNLGQAQIRALAINPVNSDILYAGYRHFIGSPSDPFWISEDRGATWNLASEGLDTHGIHAIAADPATAGIPDSTHLYALGSIYPIRHIDGTRDELHSGIFKSVDGGRSWFDSGEGIPPRDITRPEWNGFMVPSMHAIVLDPSSGLHGNGPLQTIYIGGEGYFEPGSNLDFTMYSHRIYKSTDAGSSWFPADNGLPDPVIYPIFGGWWAFPQVTLLTMDPADSDTLYAGTALLHAFWIPGLVEHTPTFALENGIFKTTDGGANWTLSSAGLPRINDDDPSTSHWDVRALAVSQSDSAVLYAATSYPSGQALGPAFVFKSVNGGVTWEAANHGIPSDAYINQLLVDPDNPDIAYAALSGTLDNPTTLYRTLDGGITWRPYTSPAAAYARTLVIDKSGPETVLHVGTAGGVFSLETGPDGDE